METVAALVQYLSRRFELVPCSKIFRFGSEQFGLQSVVHYLVDHYAYLSTELALYLCAQCELLAVERGLHRIAP